jgi:hypothetical protein
MMVKEQCFIFSNLCGRLIGYKLSMLVCPCGYFFLGRWIQLAIEKIFFSRCGYHNLCMFISC